MHYVLVSPAVTPLERGQMDGGTNGIIDAGTARGARDAGGKGSDP